MSNNDKQPLRFITIEGVDGAGKSTYIPFIKNYLESKGEEVILTREPGGTELGERLRSLLLNFPMSVMSETLLMFAARAQHIEQVIKPALAEGKWVICDRFTDSTMAYQSGAKGMPESEVKMLESLVQKEIKPGLTYVFDVPLEVSKARLNKTGKVPDKFERESDEFFNNVLCEYKNIVKRDPKRCKLVDSSKTVEETNDQVFVYLENFYNKLKNERPKSLKLF